MRHRTLRGGVARIDRGRRVSSETQRQRPLVSLAPWRNVTDSAPTTRRVALDPNGHKRSVRAERVQEQYSVQQRFTSWSDHSLNEG